MRCFIIFLMFNFSYSLVSQELLIENIFEKTIKKPSIKKIVVTKEGNYLAAIAGSNDNTIDIFQISDNSISKIANLRNHTSGVQDIEFNENGSLIVSASDDNNIKIWQRQNNNFIEKNSFFAHSEGVRLITISSEDRYIASVGSYFLNKSNEKEIKIWIKTNDSFSLLQTLKKHKDRISCIDFSSNGEYLVSSSYDNFIYIWKRKHGLFNKDQMIVDFDGDVHQVILSSDNKYLAATGELNGETVLKIWKNQNGKFIDFQTLDINLSSRSNLCFDHSEGYLFAVNKNNEIIIYQNSLGRFQKKTEFKAHFQQICSIHYIPANHILLSADVSSRIKAWKIPTLNDEIENYVKSEMKKWLAKGEFETTNEYKQRIQNRENKIKTLVNEVLNDLEEQLLKNIDWKLEIVGLYDADSETFQLKVPIGENIILPVPRSSAPGFKENKSNLIIKNPDLYFSQKQEQWILTSLEIYNPSEHRLYKYEIGNRHEHYSNYESEIDIDGFDIYEYSEGDEAFDPYVLDKNLPRSKDDHTDAIAVIICNKDYINTKDVDFALNDGRQVKKYLIEVLGYKPGNIFYRENATKGDFELYFGTKNNYRSKLYNSVKEHKSDIFVYFSGHGAPGINNKKSYFVPVDCDPNYIEIQGYPLDVFYENLAKIQAKSITVMTDACFSGMNIYENISPVILETDNPILELKNGVVFTSSKPNEVSVWYNKKQHGMFTYFFLKAIHNKNADADNDKKLTYDEIYHYISDKTSGVPYYSRKIHNQEQHPQFYGSKKSDIFIEYK